MARIQIVNQLPMRWESLYTNALKGHQVLWTRAKPANNADLTVFMWADSNTKAMIEGVPGKKIVFVRRYEYYTDLEAFAWDKVDAVVFVNPWFAEGFEERTGIKPHVIPNSVDLERWTFKEHWPGKDIAMVGFVNQKKNFPLALQILAGLPRDYKLHIAGGIQCAATVDYILNIANGLGLWVQFYDHINDINSWLDDKDYLLNTAISEGCPNCVIEAMAKGIKPIVHNWPGADELFSDVPVFNTIDVAVKLISEKAYFSADYMRVVEKKFGPLNMLSFRKLVDEVLSP